jgi:hypothetical protein
MFFPLQRVYILPKENFMGWYDVAQICLNGHIINIMAKSHPEDNQKFCQKCGAKTITTCPHCGAPIRGYYHPEEIILSSLLEVPKFCYNCGKPYPWTESKLKLAYELIDKNKKLSPQEKNILKQDIDNLVKETSDIQTTASRFKKIAKKLREPAFETLIKILAHIVSERVIKLLQ